MGLSLSYNYDIISSVNSTVEDIMSLKFFKCETCSNSCSRTFSRIFCSVKCRLLGYINKDENDCWIWNGKIGKDGYGQISIQGKRQRAHRVSYELFKKVIENKSLLLHSCHMPLCVNPDHLREGTIRENAQDMIDARRHLFGEKGTASKLTEDQVKEIICLYRKGLTQQAISERFSVSQVNISNIIRSKTWRHLLDT